MAIQIKFISIEELIKYMKAMVLLDIIMSSKEEEWLRMTTLVKGSTKDNQSFYVSNGSGDHMHVLVLDNKKAMIKGFDHESECSPYGEVGETIVEVIYEGLPECFSAYLQEEHVERNDVTFCIWHTEIEDQWKANTVEGLDDGGKDFLLGYIRQTAEEWGDWANDYYEVAMDEDIVAKIYNGEMITKQMILGLNPERDVEEAMLEINHVMRCLVEY